MKLKPLGLVPLILTLTVLACSVFQPATPATVAPPTFAVASDTPLPVDTPATTAPTDAPPATATTAPAEPSATPEAPAATATLTPETPASQFIAYLDASRQLLVTDVTGGVLGGTTQYTHADVEGQVLEFAWSPSGEYLAFVTVLGGDPTIYVVYAVGAGTPVNLGNGTGLAWSPDSTRLAFLTEFKLWQIAIDGGPRQPLTLNGDEWAWGLPIYTPAGDALVAAGARYDNMGAQGNTSYWLYALPLDGSGTLTQLPGLTAPIDGRLARDLTYSPDGLQLAFSTSWHLSACASEAAYYVMNADGSDRHTLVSPSLAARADPAHEIYFLGFDLAWTRASDGLLQSGLVRTCADFSGALVGDPQMSIVNLSGAESSIVVGQFDSLSFDRSGALIGAVARPDNAAPGEVRLYDLSGNIVLTVGPGEQAVLQP